MFAVEAVWRVCLLAASHCVTLLACSHTLSCKSIHPVMRTTVASFLVLRHIVATDAWMCVFVMCAYCGALRAARRSVCSLFRYHIVEEQQKKATAVILLPHGARINVLQHDLTLA